MLIETQTNMKFDELCTKSGILRHRTVSHTPQQNGLAERINRTLIEKLNEGIPGVEPKRFKARLVAKGFTQKEKERVDFIEVFFLVVRHTLIRLILSHVIVYDMHLEWMDVKTAFLHGELKEEIVMDQPEGFIDLKRLNWVYLLRKSLYGLKQSPRQWYLRFDNHMQKLNFQRCNFDCCVYFKRLMHEFDTKDLGSARKILGMELKKDKKNRTLFLSREKYITKVLEKFIMTNNKDVQTLLAPHFRLSSQLCPTTEQDKPEMAKVPYASAIRCLKYAMVLTRPDISSIVSVVSMFMANPRDLDNKRSLTRFIFTVNQCTKNWKYAFQSVVALSTIEAEYTAAAEAFKEAMWLKDILNELGHEQSTIKIFYDSESAICLSKNHVHHEKTKYIDIKLHFIRLEVTKGTIQLVKIHTSENMADMLTKSIPTVKFKTRFKVEIVKCEPEFSMQGKRQCQP
ncbi:hypothetical protein KPL70_021540 [Citrus sinensis]|nr:hypothetical protein KPL70_021540 [Citrus sinensis]